MRSKSKSVIGWGLVMPLLALIIGNAQAGKDLEVWATDQAFGPGVEGGLLYIWDANDLAENASTAVAEIIDLAAAAATAEASAVLAAAGCDPVGKRNHMILANKSNSHVMLAHTASKDLFFISTGSRKITGCVPVDAHYANGSPNESVVIAGDIGGQLLTKISTDYDNEVYTVVDTLDTSPDAPICGEYTRDSAFHYVTLRGGGLLVVRVSDMSIVKRYAPALVPGVGCGAFRLKDKILTTGESGASGVPPDTLYIFDTSDAEDGIFPDPVAVDLSADGDDVHGLVVCKKKTVVNSMRLDNSIIFTDLKANPPAIVAVGNMARPFSPNPTPDVADSVGRDMFIALRGAKPTTAIGAITDAARTPGVAVLHLDKDCRGFSFEVKDIAPMTANPNVVVVDGFAVNAADPHGLEVVEPDSDDDDSDSDDHD